MFYSYVCLNFLMGRAKAAGRAGGLHSKRIEEEEAPVFAGGASCRITAAPEPAVREALGAQARVRGEAGVAPADRASSRRASHSSSCRVRLPLRRKRARRFPPSWDRAA